MDRTVRDVSGTRKIKSVDWKRGNREGGREGGSVRGRSFRGEGAFRGGEGLGAGGDKLSS